MNKSIYHLNVTTEMEWVFDPVTGPAQKSVTKIKPGAGMYVIVAGGHFKDVKAGTEFHVGTDGAFDVPGEVAEFYLRQPGWYEGTPPKMPEPEQPRRAPGRPRKES